MGKYFNNKVMSAMMKSEKESRSSEAFFSSKEENTNYFGSATGQTLTVVGLENVTPKDATIRAFNVVKFDDGHQMSTNKFFSARGLRWPVGGNLLKLQYLASALENGVKIEVTPQEVKSVPMKYNDGKFVGPRNDKGETTKITDESKALRAVTYYFEEQNLPKVDLVDFNKEEEE